MHEITSRECCGGGAEPVRDGAVLLPAEGREDIHPEAGGDG